MRRKARQRTTTEDARNVARLQEVNGYLRGLKYDLWEVVDVFSMSGYIIGVRMTLKPTGEVILAQSGDDIAQAERAYLATQGRAKERDA